ncbi:MAG TPA: hypothetical protein VNN79_10590 [Actinomycetota bacterium]|jgi:hypothetical protein|nr:hypothetical protein [Actinomycetota bacterium]
MKIKKPTPAGAGLAGLVLVLSLALVPAALAGKGKPGGGGGSSCSITPGQVALDQSWTVSASGLPSTVNMILTFPDGATSTGPINVASGGTYTTTGNSNMSANWGFIAPEQTGTYMYQFVGRIKWPAGTYNQMYAQCTVTVS